MVVREKNLEEVEKKLLSMRTDLTKIFYLEEAVKSDLTFEIKRILWDRLVELYEGRKMYDKAARAMSNRAGIDVTFREKIEAYLKSAELFANAGKVDDAEEMFTRAVRNANPEQKSRIMLARKNIYFVMARGLENNKKSASALKFYEKLARMKLEDLEMREVKKKLVGLYRGLGKFKEAELVGQV